MRTARDSELIDAATRADLDAVRAALARGADPNDPAVFTRFYMRVWKLFFLEYALVALACLAG